MEDPIFIFMLLLLFAGLVTLASMMLPFYRKMAPKEHISAFQTSGTLLYKKKIKLEANGIWAKAKYCQSKSIAVESLSIHYLFERFQLIGPRLNASS